MKKKWILVIFLGLFCINFLLQVFYLDYQQLLPDEPFSIFHAQMPVPLIIKELSAGNNPPLFEILLHYWIKIFGISEFAVRFPSLIFNSFAVFVIFLLGFRFLNFQIGLTAAILFLFDNFIT